MTVINMNVKTITVIVITALCLMPIGIAEERHMGYVTHHNLAPVNMITEERHTGYIPWNPDPIDITSHYTGYIQWNPNPIEYETISVWHRMGITEDQPNMVTHGNNGFIYRIR